MSKSFFSWSSLEQHNTIQPVSKRKRIASYMQGNSNKPMTANDCDTLMYKLGKHKAKLTKLVRQGIAPTGSKGRSNDDWKTRFQANQLKFAQLVESGIISNL